MTEYLEETNNILLQVYYEFAVFLYLAQTKSSNRYIHNIMVDSMRIHMRVLADFFSTKEDNRKNKSDLLCSDLLDSSHSISINLSPRIRKYINKNTTHFTRERGKVTISDQEFSDAVSDIVSAIYKFVSLVNEGNLKKDYFALLDDKAIKEIRSDVNIKLLYFYLRNNNSISQ